MWPAEADSLAAEQRRLAAAAPEPWTAPDRAIRIAACWACFPRGLTGPGAAGDSVWVAAVMWSAGRVVDQVVIERAAGASYMPGLLALRIGPALEEAIQALNVAADVLLLDATARDHPRGAGLALHFGAELNLPSVGVTHRPLRGEGDWPTDERGAIGTLRIDDEIVGAWLRTRPGTRPLVVHPGWRVDLTQAVDVVMGTTTRHRTPEPLRRTRELARRARARSTESADWSV